jgi:photosystem II stability/assembly factor-like uncharacterized protein
LTWSTSTSTDGGPASRIRGCRLRRWQLISAILFAVVATLGLIGGGVLGAWQGLSENATNMVTAAAAGGVPVTSVHCSGLSSAYPATCTDIQGTVTLSWTAVPGSTGITVQRATTPTGTYSTIATLAGTATTYTDTTAAYNTQYYYEVFSGAAGWVSAADVDMALSLLPTGGTDDTAATGGTAFTAANLTAMSVAGGTTYTTTTNWGASPGSVVGGQQVNGVSCVGASQCWVATQNGDIWMSTNGGYGWTEQTVPGTAALAAIDFATATAGWAVGAGGLLDATSNGGTTWVAQTSGTTQALDGVSCVSATQCWVVGGGGVILETTNGGTTWVAETSGTIQLLAAVSCVSTTHCWAVGNQGVIVATANGGTTWAAETSGVGGNLTGVSFVNANDGWVVGQNGVLRVTVNGGTTWTAQTPGTGQSLDAVSMVSATTGWAVGVGGTILATTNGGTTWTEQGAGINQPINAISAVNASDAMVGLIPGGGTPSVLATTNGGASWVLPSNQYVQWSFSPTVSTGAPVSSAVVTLVDKASQSPSSTAQTYLLVSANAGSTWTPFVIANPTGNLATQTVAVGSVIGGAAAVSGMKLRYVISDGSGFTSTFDLVHVDIN